MAIDLPCSHERRTIDKMRASTYNVNRLGSVSSTVFGEKSPSFGKFDNV